ncbi:hypothetical protein ACYJEJ_003814 [Proteus mirabilis]|uniref:hypothetical protein n=1 Tax=Proteus mirabilis TaxID=584 RepID=UPI0031B7E0C0|nr:hypothetical protein [Proteus mirabilis]
MKKRKVDIKLIIENKEEIANLELISTEKGECFLKISINDIYHAEFSDTDFFSCFVQLRNKFSDIIFLCKGAKISVYPSSMSRDMSLGIAAYDHTFGKQTTREDLVNIFDFEDENVRVSPDEQRKYYYEWADSLK